MDLPRFLFKVWNKCKSMHISRDKIILIVRHLCHAFWREIKLQSDFLTNILYRPQAWQTVHPLLTVFTVLTIKVRVPASLEIFRLLYGSIISLQSMGYKTLITQDLASGLLEVLRTIPNSRFSRTVRLIDLSEYPFKETTTGFSM